MIGIGIIGCGKIAQVRHIPEYLANGHAKLIGFYDADTEKAQRLAKTYEGICYASYEELLENPEISAVSICVPNYLHEAVTVAALNKGKHVLCEKPMAMTLEACEKMVRTAKSAHKILMVGHNQRLAKAHVWAKRLIAEGLIGEILTFRTTFGHGGPEGWSMDKSKDIWFFDKNKAQMGVLADLGIHKTDLIQFLTGQKVIATTAKLATLEKRNSQGELIAVDDNALCIYQMSGGAIGVMTASWTYHGSEDNSTVLYGTKGVMHIYEDKDYAIKVQLKGGEEIAYKLDEIQTNDNQTSSGVIDEFIHCIKAGTLPRLSAEEALYAMRAVFASITSSKTGQTIKLEP